MGTVDVVALEELDLAVSSDRHARVAVRGRLEGSSVTVLRDALAAAAAHDGDVVLDLLASTDVDPTAVEAIVDGVTRLGADGRSLRIVAAPHMIRHLLHLGLGDIVRTHNVAQSRSHGRRVGGFL